MLYENFAHIQYVSKRFKPLGSDREQVVAEIENLVVVSLEAIQQSAPLVFAQLKVKANGDQEDPDKFLEDYPGGAVRFISGLDQSCEKQMDVAEERPTLMAVAKQVETRRMVLPRTTLELMTRYQTTLVTSFTRR